VEAFTVPVGAEPFDIFFRVAGGATLLGIQGSWDSSASTARFSKSPLWTIEDFDFTVDSVNDVPEAQITMRLRQPRTFTVDLSGIAVGQAFTLQSFALVTAYNRVSLEDSEGGSGSRVLLRDPLSIGGTTITHSGLEAVSVAVTAAPPDAPVLPAQCTPGPGPDPAAGTIQFSAANYAQLESSRTPSITVTRTGGSVGAVTATISTSDGTAVAGRDYTPMSSSVFFSDGDGTPRTLYLAVIDDGDHSEAAATVNLTLSQPGGCAALGAQSSAVLTITDDDTPPPPPTFTVGGTVTGLTGSGLILEDRANFFELRPTANGTFVFGSPLGASRAYDVRVKTQPSSPPQTCSVTNGTGTISNANITNIEVSCVAPVVNGALDPSFGDGGKTFTAFGGDETALALQADGKVVMVGGSVTDFTLARFTAAGRLDPDFGSAGTVTTDMATEADQARGVAIQSDGKIVVVGSAVVGRTANNLSNFDFAVARYNPDGTPDLSFSGDGKVTTDFNRLADEAHAVVIQSDGKIVVVGSAASSNLSGSLDFAIARYNPDGTLDLSFDADGKATTTVGSGVDIARNAVLQPNQAILVSGFSEVNSRDGTGLVRYTSSGALDSSFGSGGRTSVPEHRLEEGLILQSNGNFVIAGSVNVGVFPARSSHFGVMRFDANGFPDNGFGSAGLVTLAFTAQNDFGRAIALQGDGKIVVAGQSRNGANPDFAVARLNTDGTPDESFGSAGKLTVSFFDTFDGAESVVIQPDGQIVLGGFATSGTQTGYGLARVNP
jgi:uncharacterized delta-60 repeat protein